MDREIAAELGLSPIYVYKLRVHVLKITGSETHRKCVCCGKCAHKRCFSHKSKKPNWCIRCRHDNGIDAYPSMVRRSQPIAKRYVLAVCLRCDVAFKAECFGDATRDRNYICNRCRNVISKIERCSLFEGG